MRGFLNTTRIGFTITNILWTSIGLFKLIRAPKNEVSWLVILFMLLLNLVLAFSLGELMERFETLYLKGQLLSSGKYTIDK